MCLAELSPLPEHRTRFYGAVLGLVTRRLIMLGACFKLTNPLYVTTVALASVLVLAVMACGNGQPLPNIDGTVEARLELVKASSITPLPVPTPPATPMINIKATVAAAIKATQTGQAPLVEADTLDRDQCDAMGHETQALLMMTLLDPMGTTAVKAQDLLLEALFLGCELSSTEQAIAYARSGWQYIERGKYQRAIEDFDRAVKLNPANAVIYYNRSLAYGGLGQYHLAIRDLDAALRLNPNYPDAYYGRGYLYEKLGQNEQSIADFDQAVRINLTKRSAVAKVYLSRGYSYYKLGQYEQAIRDYDQAIESGLESAHAVLAHLNRAGAYHKLGQYQLAIQDYDQAITLNPESGKAYYGRGVGYVNLGRYELAVEDFSEALRLNPDYADAYYGRGYSYDKLDQKEQAERDIGKAQQLKAGFSWEGVIH